MKKIFVAGLVMALLLLAAACAPTHETVAAALAGSAGDEVHLPEMRVNTHPNLIERHPERDLLSFEACDRAGDCIRVDGNYAGQELEPGDFVRVLSGALRDGDGFLYIRANAWSPIEPPADWPD